MKAWLFFFLNVICWVFIFLPETCLSSARNIGKVSPGFKGSQIQFIDNEGLFLVSNNSNFGFGFNPNTDITSFTIVIIHIVSSRVVWSANRGVPLGNSDNFVFGDDGDAYIQSNGKVIWSTNTAGKGVSAMELLDSGNLVLVGDDGGFIWESFSHPTNTLMPNQEFSSGSKLVSNPKNNLTFSLEIKNSDMILSAGFHNPQSYWAMSKDKRRIINKVGGKMETATINGNTWKFFDQNKVFLWQFVFADGADSNTTWAAVLEDDGFIRFYYLPFYILPGKVTTNNAIPDDTCSTPNACSPYLVCHPGNTCLCPSGLNEISCKPTVLSCAMKDQATLISAGENLSYSALGYTSPSSKTTLDGCKTSCLGNCSCLAMFFDNKSGNCYLFDQIGSFEDAKNGESFESYVKTGNPSELIRDQKKNKKKSYLVVIMSIVSAMVLLVFGPILYAWRKKKKLHLKVNKDRKQDSDLPLFSLSKVIKATGNFSISNKLGQGGFGAVYKGVLDEGVEIAVKRLSKTSRQGLAEFQNEVVCIAKLQHRNLVKLLGYCIQGEEMMLIYEYMPNNSLDSFLFDENNSLSLDWHQRFHIINGIARGLLYLHQDSRLRIIHRDLKASNILLDSNMNPKISDFGLARMFKEYETEANTNKVVGTLGYISPEYAANGLFSMKSDIFSFGVLVLEIVSGKKNRGFSHQDHHDNLLGHAWRLFKEDNPLELVDTTLGDSWIVSEVLQSIHVGLSCVQQHAEDRPSMSSVIHMLNGEGALPPPQPPGFFTQVPNPEIKPNLIIPEVMVSINEVTLTQLDAR